MPTKRYWLFGGLIGAIAEAILLAISFVTLLVKFVYCGADTEWCWELGENILIYIASPYYILVDQLGLSALTPLTRPWEWPAAIINIAAYSICGILIGSLYGLLKKKH